jgi:hypothetical protein
MAYSADEARGQLLDDFAVAIDQLAFALAAVGEAYDELDERAADVLEDEIFKPLQSAYGRAKRTHSEFAKRYRQPERSFEDRSAGTHSGDPRVYLERAVEAMEQADHAISELQDSMMPVEVGDTELRAGLSETRSLIAELPARGRRLVRARGR